MEFKVNIADKSGKTYKYILKEPEANKLLGLKVGDKFPGSIIGINDYEFQITGGSDFAGFPMRKDIMGQRRIKILTGKTLGMKESKYKGWRRRKTMSHHDIRVKKCWALSDVSNNRKNRLECSAKKLR